MSEKARTSARRNNPPVRKPIPRLAVAWGVVGALFLISLLVTLYLGWYSVNEYCTGTPPHQGVRVEIAGPAFLPVGDNAEFRVTVVNERSTAADLSLELRYAGRSLCSAGAEGSHWLKFGPVQSGERASRTISILFPACRKGIVPQNQPDRQVEFEVWLSIDAQPPERINTLPLHVAPLPGTKTLGKGAGVWTAGLAVWIGKELWDQIKKTAPTTVSRSKSTAR